MTFIAKLAAILLGAHLLQDPEPCKCNSIEQNVIMTGSTTIHLVDYTRKKCGFALDTRLTITPEGSNTFDEITVSVYKSDRELVSKQVVTGTSFVRIQENFVLKKREKVWIEITSNNEGQQYLVSSISK